MQRLHHPSSLALLLVLTSCAADPCDKSWLWGWDKADDLRACAEEGHRDAQRRYGKLLALNGRPAESKFWLSRAIEGRGGKGAMEVARTFDAYDGDKQLAEAWYRRAYELGEPEAAVRLGMLHRTTGNSAESNLWFERAVDAGGSYTAGQIGFLLSHKREDAPASAAWYKRAAEMGNHNGMRRYAHMLKEGSGVPKNATEAFRWFRKAATHANADGYDLFALARAYDEGLGTGRDPKAALAVLRSAERKRIDDSDTDTPRRMKEMETRLAAELAG